MIRAALIVLALTAQHMLPARAQDAAAPGASAATTVDATLGSTVVAARPIRARQILGPADLTTTAGATPGAIADPADAVGMEARTAIYAGWPVRAADLAPPAAVERNALVALSFRSGGLVIETEGRSLGRAGPGERVRVMNLDSRVTVTGTVVGPNRVEVR